jgi:hypothetical protein
VAGGPGFDVARDADGDPAPRRGFDPDDDRDHLHAVRGDLVVSAEQWGRRGVTWVSARMGCDVPRPRDVRWDDGG